jgi:formylmethanofuran--tetrahydromethanopterin N-formyltransferase
VKIGPTFIEDTFAEAFGMLFTRLVVTAFDQHWLDAATSEFTGFSASVIACDIESGIESTLSPQQTPDGRPGTSLLAFAFSREALAAAIPNRTGQCLMTCPTTAVFDGLHESGERIALGKHLRFFGDGYQKSKLLDGRRYWRIPVMDGEFLIEESAGVAKGVAGGNIIIQSATQESALDAVRRSVTAIDPLPGVITPFPGGVARSGSKVGSRYKKLKASTSDAFCPTLRGRVATQLRDGVNCALEIVIDGVDESSVARAMATAMRAAAGEGVIAIGAGNYGGKLGNYKLSLREVLASSG